MIRWYYNVNRRYEREENSMKSITIRFSDELHKTMRRKLLEEDESVQQYIIRLVKNDLDFTKEENPDDYLKPKNE